MLKMARQNSRQQRKKHFNAKAKATHKSRGLHSAVNDRDFKLIRQKFDNLNLHCPKIQGRVVRPAVNQATCNGDREVLEFMLELGAYLSPSLKAALSSQDPDFILWYLSECDVSLTDCKLRDLRDALAIGDLNLIQKLDHYGCPFMQNIDDLYPDIMESGNPEILNWFVKEKGLVLNDEIYKATLQMVCFNIQPDMVKALDKLGMDLHQNNEEIFLRSAEAGALDLVKWFVEEKQVNPNIKEGKAVKMARQAAFDRHDPVGLETAEYLEANIAEKKAQPASLKRSNAPTHS
jgi:hypothetical protein